MIFIFQIMEPSDKFRLQWNAFDANINQAFRQLREDLSLCDVTLVCDKSVQLKAHKVILSACSPFFREIIQHNPHPHPLIYLKGVTGTDLTFMLDYMYYGEVSIENENLQNFLMVAQDLCIKGLTDLEQNVQKDNGEIPTSKIGHDILGPPPQKHKADSAFISTPTVYRPILPATKVVLEQNLSPTSVPIKSEPTMIENVDEDISSKGLIEEDPSIEMSNIDEDSIEYQVRQK